jgi:hypothetical protein
VDHLSIAPEKPAQLVLPSSLGSRDPVRTHNRDALERRRLTVLLRLFMAIPHLVWLTIWSVVMVTLSPVLWLIGLFTGRSPDGLRDIYAMWVRYSVHVYAYLYLAADPFPGFLGKPGSYPVEVDIPPGGPQNRWTIAFRIFLAFPALFLASAFVGVRSGGGGGNGGGGASLAPFLTSIGGGIAATAAFLGWWVAVGRGRMPQGLRDLVVWSLGYAAQTYAYLFLLTGRYPNSDPAVAPLAPLPAHPVHLRLSDELRRDRWLVAFRFVLTMPHAVWALLWSIVVLPLAVVTWLVALVLGRTPAPLHRFLAAYVRYLSHLYAFANLGGGPFPGFVGAAGSYPVDIRIDPPERQGRWTIAFRGLLALPALLLVGAIAGAASVATFGGWFFALFMGRMPEGLRNVIVFSTRYSAQTYGYLLFVTPRYPYSGPGDFRR